MSAKCWIDDDAGYEWWCSDHPAGFCANTENPARAKFFLIHRASHNLPDRSKPETKNPRTGNGRVKVTAERISDLIAWAKIHNPSLQVGDSNFCRTCNPNGGSSVDSSPTEDVSEYMARADRIRAQGRVPRPAGVPKPATVQGATNLYLRDPKVRAWVLQRADGRCELCDAVAPFLTERGEPYLESHHIVMLAEGGADTPLNSAACCPNCHRKLHHAKERTKLRLNLEETVSKKENANA